MIQRSARNRAFFLSAVLVAAPVVDWLAGGTAGLLHFFVTLSGIGLLAAALSHGSLSRAGYEQARYDAS